MEKQYNLKQRICNLICVSSLVACNGGGGGGSSPGPQPSELPNVFDTSSVQNIKVEILRSDNSNLSAVDLTKVGGHASYKLRLTNPNSFSLHVTDLKFSNLFDTKSKPNYYFSKNEGVADNCFSKSWYHTSGGKASLDMPANASCSFYTTSLWQGVQQQSGIDMLDYTVDDQGFGFQVKQGHEVNAWCKRGCYPVGERSSVSHMLNNDAINYSAKAISLSTNTILNSIPLSGIALGGDYVFSNVNFSGGDLSFTRYQVSYSTEQSDLKIINSGVISTHSSDNIGPPTGSATSKDGVYMTYTYSQPSLGASSTILHNLASGHLYGIITGQEPTTGVQGLDDRLYYNSATLVPLFISYQGNTYHILPLSNLSSTLPSSNSKVLGIDADGNMVIKTGSRINCYFKQAGYVSAPDLGSFSSLADNLISSNSLYTNHATLSNIYYDINGNRLATNSQIYYLVDARLCQAMPIVESGVPTPFMVVPPGNTLVITDKYTAIKIGSGYAFASIEDTSDGNNNLGQ